MSLNQIGIDDTIVKLVEEIEASTDRAERDRAAELLRQTMALYGAGLAHAIEIIRSDGAAGPRLIERFAADPAVAAILSLHDLLPAPESKPAMVQLERRQRKGSNDAITRCERCGAEVGETHNHIADIDARVILCTCHECWASARQIQNGTQVAVPERCAPHAPVQLSPAQWDSLEIPVGLAFFVTNSRSGRTFAFYPSPAGAVESQLSLESWAGVLRANPSLAMMAPDVEALIVRQNRLDGAIQCAVVPIDMCYHLIGRIRRQWTGFDGGDAVRAEIETFFADRAAPESQLSLAMSER